MTQLTECGVPVKCINKKKIALLLAWLVYDSDHDWLHKVLFQTTTSLVQTKIVVCDWLHITKVYDWLQKLLLQTAISFVQMSLLSVAGYTRQQELMTGYILAQ